MDAIERLIAAVQQMPIHTRITEFGPQWTSIEKNAAKEYAEMKHRLEDLEMADGIRKTLQPDLARLTEENERLREALRILLSSHGCLTDGQAEIPEELSAQFDITLDQAHLVRAALAKREEQG